MRESYGDSAVGYVQLKIMYNVCTVKAKITPELRVNAKNYNVIVEIDEVNEIVVTCKCLDCGASAGGCNHGIAFLMWLHRRSEEPSATSTVCYWKKAVLSGFPKNLNCLALKYITGKTCKLKPKTEEFREKFKNLNANRPLFDFVKNYVFEEVSVYQQILKYTSEKTNRSVDDFLTFMLNNMTDDKCHEANLLSIKQSKSSAWFELRFGHITASKLYEAAKCISVDGSLMETILGASIPLATEPVKRGLMLGKDIIKRVEIIKKIKISQSGLILSKDFPIFGASPDGLSKDYSIEIKCPFSNKTISNYIDGGIIKPKFMAQIQMQMLFSKKKKSLFCVASPSFEENGEKKSSK